MLGYEASLKKFKRTEIIPSNSFDHNVVTLEINYKKKTGKFTNMWRLNNMLLNNQWVKKKFKGKSKNILKQTKIGHIPKPMV